MLDYTSAVERLHARGLSLDWRQYLFVMQVVLGEDEGVAHSMVYDTSEFERRFGDADEADYFNRHKRMAAVMLQQQECIHLADIVEEWMRTEVQNAATDLKTFKYSSEDIVNMLSSLLHDRSASLEDASVRDIVTLIRELNSQGALEGTNSGFSKHFISVYPHMTALCPVCQRETDVAVGMTCFCTRCGAKFEWVEEEARYYPNPKKL